MIEGKEELKIKVYYAAKDGMAIALISTLTDLERSKSMDVNSFLNEKIIEDDGQECTPLIVAARNGHDVLIRMLLSMFSPDLEKEGVVKFDGYIIEGASALWCAACAGHLNVVKTLVRYGSDVNHPTKTNSTPLRAACFDGRLDIVKYLTIHSADIHIPNKYNNTCLMIAAYKGHLDVVSYLLENGANPNERALCGATALHFAAECGHVAVVRELLDFGAKFFTNESGMTPIKAAAERTREYVVDFLVSRPETTKEDQIEALELLGASFANDKENYDIVKAYKYLHMSMKLRYSDPDNIIKKPAHPPIPAYSNHPESQTLQQLERLRADTNALHMESLTIRERVLGVHNPEVPHPVIYRGAIYADHARFDRCLQLWLHALQLRQRNRLAVVKDLLRFAQVFSQMLHVGVKVDCEQVVEVLRAAVEELRRNKERVAECRGMEECEVATDELESNLTTSLYLLTILTKLLKNCGEDQKFEINRIVFSLNQLDLTVRDGQTLLHLSCNSETPVDDFHTNDVCKFPCVETTELLIECGADVNAMDLERNTPLHTIVNYHKPISDFKTLYLIISYLVGAGAHVDSVNLRGETPLDSSATGSVAEIILKTHMKLSLKCMAANAVKHHNLTYQGQVPRSLESFIELHGPGIRKA